MKHHIYLIALVFISINGAFGQKTISDTKSSSGIDEIVIECQWANVVIKNGGSDQIKLEGTSLINKGENDDAFLFSWNQKGGKMYFSSDIENMEDLPKYVTFKKDGQEVVRRLEKGEKVKLEGCKGI